MFTIRDAVRAEFGTSLAATLPEGAGWQRVGRCLACGRHKTAEVNHDLGWYICHHAACNKKLSARSVWAIRRFAPQISQAARNVHAAYGKWIEVREAEQVAAERAIVYAGDRREGDADSGMLDSWEQDADGDQEQLDRYVLQALNCDLLNWARGKVRAARRTSAPDMADWNWNQVDNEKATAARQVAAADRSLPEYGFSARDYPFLYAREVEGFTVTQVAEKAGVSPRTVKRRTRAERARLESVTGRAA